MMGVGKSSIGIDLSRKLNNDFVDIDKIIEKKLSLSITEIFKKKGEKFFRDLEEKETVACLKKEKSVIALGGGAFMNRNIREASLKNCVSFWLDLDVQIIFQRNKNNMKRPLLNAISSESELKELYEKRKENYAYSNYRINCNSKTKDQIIVEILKIYEDIKY